MRKLFLAAALLGLAGCSTTQSVPGAFHTYITPLHTRIGLMDRLATQGFVVMEQGDKLRLVIPADHFFEVGTPTLKPQRYLALNYLTALLNTYGRTPMQITGYTDDLGSSDKENCILSQQRAESVRAYLWTHGIIFRDMVAVGKGDHSPVADNRTTKGQAANRRVEITLRK